MSPRRALSRDSCTEKTTSAKARKIKNSTRNRLKKKKNDPAVEGVAMFELSNGTKKHTSKSRETIPLSVFNLLAMFLCFVLQIGEDPDREGLIETPNRAAKVIPYI
jgi:hypothetical protein